MTVNFVLLIHIVQNNFYLEGITNSIGTIFGLSGFVDREKKKCCLTGFYLQMTSLCNWFSIRHCKLSFLAQK